MSKVELGAYLLSALFLLLNTALVIFNLPQLPPLIPLWYSREWGTPRLAPPEDLRIIPTLSFLLLTLNVSLSLWLSQRREEVLSLVMSLLTVVVNFFLLISSWRIVTLVGPTLRPPSEYLRLLPPFLSGLLLALLLTPVVIRVGKKFRLIDQPHGPYTKVRPLVRLGGLVLLISFAIPALILTPSDKSLLVLLLGGLLLILGGLVDDFRHLSPRTLGALHLLAALVLVGGGLSMDYVRNPLSPWVGGGLIYLVEPLGAIFTIIWVFSLINIVNWLDGLDGLASGVGLITALTIFAISFKFHTPLPMTLALILTGALLGFLPFNFHPAKIILGSGAYILGFLIAALAIYSDGRTATALLVLSVPALDTLIVIRNRIREGKPPHLGDKTHLHHRLLNKGLSTRQTVFVEWGLAVLMGIIALSLTGLGKLLAILVVFTGGLLFNELAAENRSRKEESGLERQE